MNTNDYLLHLLEQRKILSAIVRDADPASGISFMVRRGVAADNEDVENDCEKRPWATIQTGDLPPAFDAINTLLVANAESISRFKRSLQEEIDRATETLKGIPDEHK